MNDHFWRAISVDCIDPEYFPSVPLFTKVSSNYVLYKDGDRPFSDADRTRLRRNNTHFMYVRSGDMAEIAAYLEKSLKELLSRNDLSSEVKGKILYQTSINYLVDVFEEPEQAANVQRCRQLVQQMMYFVAHDGEALNAIRSLVGNNLYIFAHSVQVAALNLLAHETIFRVDPDEMLDVGIGSLLHDYGMVFINSDVYKKADALSNVEYYKLKQHTQKGYEYLKELGLSDVALTIVRHHHERYDGNGFPAGMKGEQIPRSAQLSALCDIYSSLTMERENRKPSSHDDAIKIMQSDQGAFDPELLAEFTTMVSARKQD